MDPNTIKHLEFIQAVITRMNTNSFLVKGWMVTLVSALFALAAKDAQPRYVLITYIAIFIFWFLDSYYLSHERQYRWLYDQVRLRTETDFSMDASAFRVGRNTWLRTIFSPTILSLYPPMIGISLLVMFFLQRK